MGGNQSQYCRRSSYYQQSSYYGTAWGQQQRSHFQPRLGYGHNHYYIRQRLSFGAPPPRLLVNATHTLYEEAFGYQSLTPKDPRDINKSIFALTSVSKTFIGVAVMQLVEQELIDLDTDVNQYR
ncbi:unnamed protein product [Rotaria sp. Silwood1]|nr:unnamed protein product [Rotaria sp. Silwood1]